MIKNLKIFLACWAMVVVVAILVVLFMYIFGLFEILEIYIWIHFTVGAIFIILFCWPYFSKKIK